MKNILRSSFTSHVIVGGLGFAVLASTFTLDSLIVMLNGLFVGSIVSLLVAFGPLIWSLFRGKQQATRAQELALGFFALWIAYILTAYVSVWTRSIGEATANPSYMSALSRYIAVYAAVRQVTAPDYGLGFIYGRDRKILLIAMGLGLLVAVGLWIVQDQALLSGMVADIFARSKFGLVRAGFGGHLVALG